MSMSKIVALILVLVFSPVLSRAFCLEPTAPGLPLGPPLSTPFCGSYGDLSGCEQWDIDNYKRESEAYIADMDAYSDKVEQYARDAFDYARCRSDEAVDNWNTFIGK